MQAKDGFVLSFDGDGTDQIITDDTGNGYNMKLFGKGAVISDHERKFGSGSLRLMNERGTGIRQSLAGEPHQKLAGELSAMSLVCWILLPADVEFRDGFFLAGRSYERKVLGMLENEDETPGVWRWMFNRDRGLWFEIGRGGKVRVDMGGALQTDELTGKWTHVAMTFDQGVVNFYINAALVHTGVIPGGVTMIPAMEGGGENSTWSIGMNPGYAHPPLPYGSYLDDFGYFPQKVLSEGEIEAIYQAGLNAFIEKAEGSAAP